MHCNNCISRINSTATFDSTKPLSSSLVIDKELQVVKKKNQSNVHNAKVLHITLLNTITISFRPLRN
jgi:hypothetical protein